MPFYLSEYIGAGTKASPYIAVGHDQPGAAAIDLRPDASRLDGGGLNACFLWTPVAFSDARARFLADDKLEALTNPQKNFLTNKLGVDLSSPTLLRDIIATIMNFPPANGWNAIRPGRLRWEIWLGGLLWEAPRASGGATDNFNRTNETPVASPWTQLSGSATTINLASNALALASGANAYYYYSGAATSADQYAQVVPSNGFSFIAPAVRIGSNNFSGYQVEAAFQEQSKFVDGSITLMHGSIQDPDIGGGAPVYIEASGSSILAKVDGVTMSDSPITDTSLTTAGFGVGVLMGETSGTLDDWAGADLGGPPVEGPPFVIPFRVY